MPVKHFVQPIDLTHPKQLQRLVENRRVYNLNNCELNIFESYQQDYRVPLTFGDFVITSMVQGKKIMHLFDQPSFEYQPGETVIVPANETMVIDFPEASAENPTQCIALSVDEAYIRSTLQYLNEYYNGEYVDKNDWRLQFNQYHFNNDVDLTDLINKLVRICSSSDLSRDIYADLNMKELLIRILQSQHLQLISDERDTNSNNSRLHFVLHYINEHLTENISVDTLCRKAYLSRNVFFKWFKDQFGITPLQYINRERLKLAKQLLADRNNSVGQVSMLCGFNDTNYFIRLFRSVEGITPGTYQLICTR
ncbi:AraC family transcriptional regulator [Chitinophaga ginsengisegetis]|uniref:AraC family transcriptional regulator n=1 Tax=Chitinophaga ginsengisegetis TaxID=393003 RepID=UPI000DBA6BE6|nr:AraC family transcriptional regulator [Chitinophaga ginsengisegetis]MDR6568619.1 AraC-like DNA-binding protein [Chitinophaga ginsengisegetis]MDR6648150.1 AraC-like DNA-binding protein [Chitinophaga ginsengisegetis]MDR6654700.1 AraC-like DNA-binding protein [Chitinophaga ginsengisegetis]